MDMYGSSYQPNPNQPYRSRRSARMEAASLILGSIALLSCTCLYLAVPCGALAVIFATLSRGGMMSYTSKAQIGMILGDHCINCNNCTVCIRSGVCHPSVWKYRWIFKGLF